MNIQTGKTDTSNAPPLIISTVSPKGGVGKTTSITALGLCISKILNKKVLMIDLDNIGSLTNNLQGDKVRYSDSSTVLNLFDDPENNSLITVRNISENLDLIQGDSQISSINSKNSIQLISRLEENLFTNLHGVNSYDYILIDTPAGDGNSVLAALICSDIIYTPIDLDPNAISAIDALTKIFKPIKRKMNSKLLWKGLLINRVQKLITIDGQKVPESLNHRKVFSDLKNEYSDKILSTVGLRNSIQLSVSRGKWLSPTDPSAIEAINEITTFCENLLGIKA